MTVKEWLLRAKNIEWEINKLTEERETAYDKATAITSSTSGERVQGSKGNITEEKYVAYLNYSLQIEKHEIELIHTKMEIENAIHKVDDNTSRMLLICRYISFMTWEQIAEEMHYSFKHVVHTLHPKALKKIKEVIECNIGHVL